MSSHCSKCPELQDTEEHSYFKCSCKPFRSVSIRNSTVTKPSNQSWASTRVVYLEHLCLLLSYLSLLHHRRHGRDRWDVLSSFAPLPIHLSFSVTCRGIERLPPSEKTFPPTDTFYIWTPASAPPSSPLSFLCVVVSCDLLSTRIRQVRWKTRGGEGTLPLTSSSFSPFQNVQTETERLGREFICVWLCISAAIGDGNAKGHNQILKMSSQYFFLFLFWLQLKMDLVLCSESIESEKSFCHSICFSSGYICVFFVIWGFLYKTLFIIKEKHSNASSTQNTIKVKLCIVIVVMGRWIPIGQGYYEKHWNILYM